MRRVLIPVLASGIALGVGCQAQHKLVGSPGALATSDGRGVISELAAEGIVLNYIGTHGGDPAKVELVSSNLEEGIWYVLVKRIPAMPGAHTTYKVRTADGAIVGFIPGIRSLLQPSITTTRKHLKVGCTSMAVRLLTTFLPGCRRTALFK